MHFVRDALFQWPKKKKTAWQICAGLLQALGASGGVLAGRGGGEDRGGRGLKIGLKMEEGARERLEDEVEALLAIFEGHEDVLVEVAGLDPCHAAVVVTVIPNDAPQELQLASTRVELLSGYPERTRPTVDLGCPFLHKVQYYYSARYSIITLHIIIHKRLTWSPSVLGLLGAAVWLSAGRPRELQGRSSSCAPCAGSCQREERREAVSTKEGVAGAVLRGGLTVRTP